MKKYRKCPALVPRPGHLQFFPLNIDFLLSNDIAFNKNIIFVQIR